jgi:hypothetical protein
VNLAPSFGLILGILTDLALTEALGLFALILLLVPLTVLTMTTVSSASGGGGEATLHCW